MALGEKAPYFKFFVFDWDSDFTQRKLDCAGAGIYTRLLVLQWIEGGLEDDVDALRAYCGASEEEWDRAWRRLEAKFPLDEDGNRRNPKLESTRSDMEQSARKRRTSAKKGAESRWSAAVQPHPKNVPDIPNGDASHDADAMRIDANQNQNQNQNQKERARFTAPSPVDDPDDPEDATKAVIGEINRWLPDQKLKLHAGLVKPIANLLLCGHPDGVTKIRGDPQLFTPTDLIDLAHGYIVAEATNPWHIEQRARGTPYAFARLVRDSARVAEYAENGRNGWDAWRVARSTASSIDREAEAIAECPREHAREKERLGRHWACPDKCGWTEVIRGKVEEPV